MGGTANTSVGGWVHCWMHPPAHMSRPVFEFCELPLWVYVVLEQIPGYAHRWWVMSLCTPNGHNGPARQQGWEFAAHGGATSVHSMPRHSKCCGAGWLACRRLVNEMEEIFKAQDFNLVASADGEDGLYTWTVSLAGFCPGSQLAQVRCRPSSAAAPACCGGGALLERAVRAACAVPATLTFYPAPALAHLRAGWLGFPRVVQDMHQAGRKFGVSSVQLQLAFKRGLHPFYPPSVQLLAPRYVHNGGMQGRVFRALEVGDLGVQRAELVPLASTDAQPQSSSLCSAHVCELSSCLDAIVSTW